MIGFAPMTRMRAFILAEVLFIVMIVAGVFFYMNRDDDVADRLTEYRASCSGSTGHTSTPFQSCRGQWTGYRNRQTV